MVDSSITSETFGNVAHPSRPNKETVRRTERNGLVIVMGIQSVWPAHVVGPPILLQYNIPDVLTDYRSKSALCKPRKIHVARIRQAVVTATVRKRRSANVYPIALREDPSSEAAVRKYMPEIGFLPRYVVL